MIKVLRVWCDVVVLGMVGLTCHAQWTTVNLHPADAALSFLSDVRAGQQGGTAVFGAPFGSSGRQAGFWTGTAASWTTLTPVGAAASYVNCVIPGQQGGSYRSTAGNQHACVWNSTPWSLIDLHPPGALRSVVEDMDGTRQVGFFMLASGHDHAALWNSSAASLIDLHPDGLSPNAASWAAAAFGNRQAGVVILPGVSGSSRASLWSGTKASWVDMNPPGATGSEILGMHGGRQVGAAVYGEELHATIWSGTPESAISLLRAGDSASRAVDIWGAQVVGFVQDSALVVRATYWEGTPPVRTNLHAFLQPGYNLSVANSVWSDTTATYVAGYAWNTAANREEAMLWIGPPPAALHCRADLTSSAIPGSVGYGSPNGTLENDDFFYYLVQFAAGSLGVADMTTIAVPGQPGYGVPNGFLTNDDFFYYLALFAAGC